MSFRKLTIDRKSENKDAVVELVQRYRIKRFIVSTYHPQVNGKIKCGHKAIIDTVLKMSNSKFTN